jgi:hypothetical protein
VAIRLGELGSDEDVDIAGSLISVFGGPALQFGSVVRNGAPRYMATSTGAAYSSTTIGVPGTKYRVLEGPSHRYFPRSTSHPRLGPRRGWTDLH